ncbi:MAG: TusE/DsrC/DsvC family sulfur relay protein [Ketobacteraceae bacterium]|nr:TusE/DsrC/DsvC family sulfur relay protein [Ketobacteraceae bacterium]
MSELTVNGKAIPVDKEGYLKELSDWNPEVAGCIAARENIELTPAHWEIIDLLRAFHQQFEHAPNMRALVKYTQQQLGKDKGKSIYIMKLFPGSSAKLAAKIAGLPRPTHCL